MSNPPPHFLLVDDHALFRTGLGMMLSQSWPQARVTEAASLAEAFEALRQAKPDLILLDVRLPDGQSLAHWGELRALAPAVPVLLMSAEVSGEQILAARDAGVMGFVPKVATAGEVLRAVEGALQGQANFASVPYEVLSQAQQMPQTPGAPAALHVADAGASLSERQLEILRYLGRGTPNKAIARQLGLSESDVRADVSWLTEWLGANSREEAYAAAVARGLLSA